MAHPYASVPSQMQGVLGSKIEHTFTTPILSTLTSRNVVLPPLVKLSVVDVVKSQ